MNNCKAKLEAILYGERTPKQLALEEKYEDGFSPMPQHAQLAYVQSEVERIRQLARDALAQGC